MIFFFTTLSLLTISTWFIADQMKSRNLRSKGRFKSIKDTKYINAGLEIIQKNGELLAYIRYPHSAGASVFVLLNNEEEFLHFLSMRKAGESITLFKRIEKSVEDLITGNDNEEILRSLGEKSQQKDWLVLITDTKRRILDSFLCMNKPEIRKVLNDYVGKNVIIMEEPDWTAERETYHAYAGGRASAY
ncbi:MAG: hypothetical protein KDE26_22170 [Bacteroidetes bacterium]|nr:hypothetical protein [Bacteroidota bacterium]